MIYLHKYDSLKEFKPAYEWDEYAEPWVSYTTETTMVVEIENPQTHEIFTYTFVYTGLYDCIYDESGEQAGKWYVWTNYEDNSDAAVTQNESPSVGDTVRFASLDIDSKGNILEVDIISDQYQAQITSIETVGRVDYNQRPFDYVFDIGESDKQYYEGGFNNPNFPQDAVPAFQKIMNGEPFRIKIVSSVYGAGYVDENDYRDIGDGCWQCKHYDETGRNVTGFIGYCEDDGGYISVALNDDVD